MLDCPESKLRDNQAKRSIGSRYMVQSFLIECHTSFIMLYTLTSTLVQPHRLDSIHNSTNHALIGVGTEFVREGITPAHRTDFISNHRTLVH